MFPFSIRIRRFAHGRADGWMGEVLHAPETETRLSSSTSSNGVTAYHSDRIQCVENRTREVLLKHVAVRDFSDR